VEGVLLSKRVVALSGVAIVVAFAAAMVAQVLTGLIGLITNLAFYGRWSTEFTSPAGNKLGAAVILVPIAGAIVVGAMARWGSQAIRGHGIPEAMERVLFHQSKIQPRITLLKPLSAAIAIGTGGPFGAEGPIIATGGALGSVVGQILTVTADERKVLLAAGAAAGMSATFGSPVAAVLLAIELLLFEYRARSIIPVALASATATGVRMAMVGPDPIFKIFDIVQPSGAALALYIGVGAVTGGASVLVTRAVYWVEDMFEKLPIHFMWWPALGAVAVGVCGYLAPKTLGVGYDNIESILQGSMVGRTLALFCALKFISWAISLGSGTSGGTLAPLFTIGGGLGSILGSLVILAWPGAGVDVRVAALVGMAAMFAGASRALLASVVFAFEITRQPMGLLPLLGGSTAAYLVSLLGMKNSIMTERIARRGARVQSDYVADFLAQVLVRDCASMKPVVLKGSQSIAEVRVWIDSGEPGSRHTGYPVVDAGGEILGVLTRRDLLPDAADEERVLLKDIIARPPVVVFDDSSAREATDHMIAEGVGRLPIVTRAAPHRPIGIITRSDLVHAHRRRLDEAHQRHQALPVPIPRVGRRSRSDAASIPDA
jgi:H+/Cl- antiporter ClcA